MHAKLLMAGLVATSTLIAPLVTRAADDGDKDRKAPATYVKDSVITTKIKTRLAAEKPSSLAKITVDTDANGMVVLGGTARNQAAIDRAGAIASATEGVVSVRNNIKIKVDD